MSQAKHLKAHALRLVATAERFRHGGHAAVADEITAQAERYFEAAASLEAGQPEPLRELPAHVASLAQSFPAHKARQGANGGAHT